MTCTCPSKDWFHFDQSWIQFNPDCPEHKDLVPDGIMPTESEEE